MALNNLFDDGDDLGEENCKLSINKKFAEKYHKFKECQELDKLKDKYGPDADLSSSSSESEDDDAEGLTPQIEKDFLLTLSMIKGKDPKIYEKDSVFFPSVSGDDTNNSNDNKKSAKKNKDEAIYLKDYERKRLLEKGEKAYLSDSDDESGEKNGNDATYVEEQNHLKESLLSAAQSDDSDSGDELLQIRKDISDDAKKELEKPDSKLEGLAPKSALDRYWKDDEIGADERFLRDYILQKQFKDNGDSGHIPTYNEVVEDLDEDLDAEEEFERKFNFRYEDPDPEFIKQYPRTINESVRQKDDRRKQQRKDREERKKKEKEKKKEELKRLKNLKRKEIMEKIEKLKEITGNDKVGFLEEDMQNDFDISKYDQLMEKVFDEDYYDENDSKEEGKPVFSDEEEYFEGDNDIYDDDGNYIGDDYEPHCEDPGFVMDADYVPKEKNPNSKMGAKRRRGMNAKFLEAVQREKPKFDPSQKTFEEYFDEYYKLDFEDIIDDIPVRFKYREVIPNDFGLTTDEVLKAEDKELNEWCSLRNTTRYLGNEEERKLQRKFKKKARDKKKKLQVFTSLKEEHDKEAGDGLNANKEAITKPRNLKMLQKKKKTLIPSWNNSQRRSILSAVNKTKMKQIRNKFKGGSNKTVNKLSLQRLAAYGLDEKKNK